MTRQKELTKLLNSFSEVESQLFTISDFSSVFPDMNYTTLKAFLGRAERNGLIRRVCKGLYLNGNTLSAQGLFLYHAASYLRSDSFNYLSLESVLSESGVISQIPLNRITLMGSGRSYTYSCGNFGTIEFVHTRKKPDSLADKLIYDIRYRLWRANIALALSDMKRTGRSMDLVDWRAVDDAV
jgi:hypothetical protein